MKLPFWLIASALLNFVLIGFVAGFLLRPVPDRPRRDFAQRENIRLIGELTRETRRAMKSEAEAHRAAQKELIEALRREPFDREAVRARLDGVRATEAVMKAALDEALLDKFESLSPDERERVVRAMSDGHDRRQRRRDRED